ncbi:MFS transporter [Actinokineospora diospyrosa]|uniref:MFS-type transporter involved in bile tolerance, Atg22 family n=1 Tax=Actinokineospora diospyrosa TaxID=103728 RepID=A0ABT1I743_9PSEU|nr:MFS transporter [Actinokineospora diospyrosa]MCP2268216.1 MFS-type transporter involved in bile tolerance, Atg22 family [Actinokineospora diospyrosa]
MLGRSFGWLWAAYAVSAYGTGLSFGAFSFVAITVLNATSAEVATLSSAGLVIGALLAVPLGPWMESRAKRPVMIAMDLTRFAALSSIPLAYALDALSYPHLLLISVVTAAAKIASSAASGAHLRTLVPPDKLLLATSRLESTTWSATTIAPPLGGAAVSLLGPVITVALDAASYLLSALGIAAIKAPEPPKTPTRQRTNLIEGWRYLITHRQLRRYFLNAVLVNALIMATEPLLAVLMLSHLNFPAWQYALALATPCLGGLLGSRLAPRLTSRYGQQAVLRASGIARSCWPLCLAFVQPGIPGLAIVIATQLALIVSISIFTPTLSAYRLTNTTPTHHTRLLTAWAITSAIATAATTVLWGFLAELTTPRTAIALAGALLLATPLLLPRHNTPD